MPPLPSATPTWHNDTYEAISPQRTELSAAGKRIVIIGAGSGIGRETAKAFATAAADHLVLIGRHETSLKETAALTKSASVEVHASSVGDLKSLRRIASLVGTWDVLVLSAAHCSTPSPMASADPNDWWQSFEINTKGVFNAIQAFIPTANVTNATFLALTSGSMALPVAMLPGMSTYMASKLAQVKIIEFLAAEQPNILAATVHPGMIETDIFTKTGAKANLLPMDNVKLPAHFLVWMSSPEASFLKGRSVWANWDVEEMKAQAKTIQTGIQMTSGINGWPYPNM
ncbi:hypothetical protein VMCG_09089 [Cytospora schulzeri]|uniref:Uncharacterized protein n=1 Tax=Cytospora schulzeri TaxID=448051 RepID=A0A423VP30_9PEZI|nr:hypothetical protein VMCG_09089 [Valsa malicola]